MTKRKNNKANKPTRKAESVERARAAFWADLYRQAQTNPEKVVRVPEMHSFAVQADDTEFLITLLENFAKHGTFEFIPDEGLSDAVMALRYSSLRKSMNARQAIIELETTLHKANSAIRRPLARIRARFPLAEAIKARREERSSDKSLEQAWGIRALN